MLFWGCVWFWSVFRRIALWVPSFLRNLVIATIPLEYSHNGIGQDTDPVARASSSWTIGITRSLIHGIALWDYFGKNFSQFLSLRNLVTTTMPLEESHRQRSRGARILKLDNWHHYEAHSSNYTVGLFWGKLLTQCLAQPCFQNSHIVH